MSWPYKVPASVPLLSKVVPFFQFPPLEKLNLDSVIFPPCICTAHFSFVLFLFLFETESHGTQATLSLLGIQGGPWISDIATSTSQVITVVDHDALLLVAPFWANLQSWSSSGFSIYSQVYFIYSQVLNHVAVTFSYIFILNSTLAWHVYFLGTNNPVQQEVDLRRVTASLYSSSSLGDVHSVKGTIISSIAPARARSYLQCHSSFPVISSSVNPAFSSLTPPSSQGISFSPHPSLGLWSEAWHSTASHASLAQSHLELKALGKLGAVNEIFVILEHESYSMNSSCFLG